VWISFLSARPGEAKGTLCTSWVDFVPEDRAGGLRRNVVHADEVDGRGSALAGRQHGVVTSAQLAAVGCSARQVEHRVAKGWLHRLHRGVYLVGPLGTPHTAAMAAVLATGGVVSSYPAAVLWDWRPPREGPIDITVPARKVRSRAGIVVHHTDLHPRDITRRHGIPVTAAARTLLDLATTPELDKALNEAMLHKHVSLHSLNEQFSRYPHHHGTATLRKYLESEPKLTRSDAEILALELIRRARLPVPETNTRVEGYECDLVWRDHNLIVEIDSWAFHSMRSSFENDRRRDQRLTTAGWRVIRITARQLTYEPELVIAILTRALFAPR
jgi:very-short-patch-repair endonuclease